MMKYAIDFNYKCVTLPLVDNSTAQTKQKKEFQMILKTVLTALATIYTLNVSAADINGPKFSVYNEETGDVTTSQLVVSDGGSTRMVAPEEEMLTSTLQTYTNEETISDGQIWGGYESDECTYVSTYIKVREQHFSETSSDSPEYDEDFHEVVADVQVNTYNHCEQTEIAMRGNYSKNIVFSSEKLKTVTMSGSVLVVDKDFYMEHSENDTSDDFEDPILVTFDISFIRRSIKDDGHKGRNVNTSFTRGPNDYQHKSDSKRKWVDAKASGYITVNGIDISIDPEDDNGQISSTVRNSKSQYPTYNGGGGGKG